MVTRRFVFNALFLTGSFADAFGFLLVAPHFFKPDDLDALSGVKKGHVKQIGARAEGSR